MILTHTFPNGIPNPLLVDREPRTYATIWFCIMALILVLLLMAILTGVSFLMRRVTFVSGEYIVGLLGSVFLDKEPYAKIVHDPRVIWNIQDTVKAERWFLCAFSNRPRFY